MSLGVYVSLCCVRGCVCVCVTLSVLRATAKSRGCMCVCTLTLRDEVCAGNAHAWARVNFAHHQRGHQVLSYQARDL